MFLPEVMRPVPALTGPANPRIRQMAEVPFSVVQGPPGSYVAERLAAAVEAWGRFPGCVWLRATAPQAGTIAGSLASACQHRWAEGDEWDPGPPEPGARLVETLRRSPAGAVIVLELRGRVSRAVRRLVADLRPIATGHQVSLITIRESRLPSASVPTADCLLSSADLWDSAMLDESGALPQRSRDRLVELARHRPAVLADVLEATATWPPDAVADGLDVRRRFRPTLDRLTENLLGLCTPAQREALEVCATVGYWHPQLGTETVQATELRPWVVPLEREWGWLRPIWARSVQRALAGPARRRHTIVGGHPIALPYPPRVPDAARPEREDVPTTLVEARLFGTFELRLDRSAVTWSGQRGVSVLRYLLARPGRTCSRDQLIEEFWPDTPAPKARNRLQVAVSGLRQGLREMTPLQVIEYVNGGYRINPQLRVTVDIEQFEAAVATGRAAERSGDPDAALTAYAEAIKEYRDDFASDAPFEQWTLLPRESLRLAYLDALDRMSRILFGMGRLDECIATAHRMLDVDPCREDAHRLVMRCYLRLGRPYQALRQYEMCCRVLRVTLSARPTPETTRVYESILARFQSPDPLPR
jgi:DNA-binding SARP family transcriptional activator